MVTNIGCIECGKMNQGWFPGFRIGLKPMGTTIRDLKYSWKNKFYCVSTAVVVDGDIWGGNNDFNIWCLEFEMLRAQPIRKV